MPQIINQTGVSIDSLQAKLTLLENQFAKLSSEHKVVLDSLKGVTQTAMKAEISTSFYSTHLSTYTAIFGGILALVGLISFGWLFLRFKSIDENFETLDKETIPNLTDSVNNRFLFLAEEIDGKIDETRAKNNITLSWSLKAMILLYTEKGDPLGILIFQLRYMEFMINDSSLRGNIELDNCDWLIGQIEKSLGEVDFKNVFYPKFKDELDEILNLLKESKHSKILKFYYQKLEPLVASENSPT